MPFITGAQLRQHNSYLTQQHKIRLPWAGLWRELSDNYLPQRYRWLMKAEEYYSNRARRQYILNNTGTQAARTLAAGMMNGVTSPSRPWFKLRVPGLSTEDERNHVLSLWLEEVERVLLRVMSESNFYNSMAVLYLDLVVFGTAASLIYEDRESVIRCYNPPLGEYYLACSDRGQVNVFSRKFELTVSQFIQRWPDRRYWSDRVKNAVQTGGASLENKIEISHIIAPNMGMVASRFEYYELYWESKRTQDTDGDRVVVMEKRGFNELPGIFARWELSGSDPYGVSPAMDALGDNIELQHLHRNKAELLEKTHKPPLLVDIVLQNNPLGLMPRGVTYVPNLGTSDGAKPIFTVDPRFDQINVDQLAIEDRLRKTFFNFLFTGISDLQTVRSAAEIDSRESEKLILLGGVLERLESEGLDPGIMRVYSIADRAGLIPPIPPQYAGVELEIQYVSILSIAQRAAGTAPTERGLAFAANVAALIPSVLDIPDFDKVMRNYFLDIGFRQSELKSQDQVEADRAQEEANIASAQALEAGNSLAQSAKLLSETDTSNPDTALSSVVEGG